MDRISWASGTNEYVRHMYVDGISVATVAKQFTSQLYSVALKFPEKKYIYYYTSDEDVYSDVTNIMKEVWLD